MVSWDPKDKSVVEGNVETGALTPVASGEFDATVLNSTGSYLLATHTNDEPPVLVNVTTHELVTLPDGSKHVAFTPDGRQLLLVNGKNLERYDIAMRKTTMLETLSPADAELRDLSLSADGRYVALCDERCVTWDLETRQRYELRITTHWSRMGIAPDARGFYTDSFGDLRFAPIPVSAPSDRASLAARSNECGHGSRSRSTVRSTSGM